MLDTKHYTFLLGTIGVPSGRAQWFEYKTRQRWIDLSYAELPGRDLREYDLSEINLANAVLTGANLSGANLSDANLESADLRLATLRGTSLARTNLSLALLEKAALVDAQMGGVILRGAQLQGMNATGADLAKADLIDANLSDALFRYANLKGAMIEGVDITGVDLTGALLDEDAPALVKNFNAARVDDRRYREMRSRIAAVERGLVHAGAGADASGSAYRKPRFSNYTAARTAAESGVQEAKARLEEGIPVRTVEPDLTTTEGCCEILEIELNATKEQIVKAFRRKAKIYHPDKVRHLGERLQELAALEFQRLHLAYEQLTRGSTRLLTGIRWPEGFVQKTSPSDYTIEEYERLAEFNPSSVDVLYNLAWKYFEAGRHRECMEGYQRVIRFNPKDEDAQFNLMIVRLCMGIEDGAGELDTDTGKKRLTN